MTVEFNLHHLCIYDENTREHVWTWLKWNHAISQYYWGGEELHLTDEGHVDYTFIACGSPFQIQLEQPPYQFEYERNWYDEHGSGINHVCWIVPDAQAAADHLMASGCETVMPFTDFGVYRGFVAADPEGRWIEIMEYLDGFKTPDVEFRPFGFAGLQLFGPTQFTEDLAVIAEWYRRVLGLHVVHGGVDRGIVFLADEGYSAERNIAMILAEPSAEAERSCVDRHGPAIGGINLQAVDVERADEDAEAAGFERVTALVVDERTRLRTALFREPSGNLVYLREQFNV